MAGSIYAGVDEFRIVDVDEVVLSAPNYIVIEEPVDFRDLEIVLERSKRGGFDFEYGSSETSLRFDKAVGKSTIEQIFDISGVDMSVILEYRNEGNLIYQGNLIGSSMIKVDSTLEFRVKRFDFGNKLKTRFDAVVNVEDVFDLDGNAISPLTLRNIPLHSQKVLFTEQRETTALDEADFGVGVEKLFSIGFSGTAGIDAIGWFLPSYDIRELGSNLEGFFNYGNSIGSEPEPRLAITDSDFQGVSQVQDFNVQQAEGLRFFALDFEEFKGEITITHNLDLGILFKKVGGGAIDFEVFVDGRCVITDGNDIEVASISRSGTSVTVTTFAPHGLQVGDSVAISGVTPINYNGVRFVASVPSETEFIYATQSTSTPEGDEIIFDKVLQEIANGTDSEEMLVDEQTGNITISDSSFTINIERNNRVYFYYRFSAVGNIAGGDIISVRVTQINQANVKFEAITEERPTIIKGGYFNEVLDKCLEQVTGESGLLESSLFQNRPVNDLVEGCGGLNIVSSGFKIRQRDQDLRFKISDLISLAESRWGCGSAIYYDGGVPKFLLEKDDFFFQDKKIMTIDILDTKVHDPVRKKINKEILANYLVVGFERFARSNESGTVEGISTQSEYLTPIEKDEKKLSFLSKIVGDGTEIERVRRNGIRTAEDESDEKDDEGFVVKMHEFGGTSFYQPSVYGSDDFLNIQRDADNGRIIINGLIIQDLQTNDYINISGETNRQIDGTIVLDVENNRTILPCSTETENDIIYNDFNFRESDDLTPRYTYNPQRLEGFSNVTGLIDPRTSYNIDHANSQFLLWNFGWFGGSLLKKGGSSEVRFMTKKAVTTLQKQYVSDVCGLSSLSINERQDFSLTFLRNVNPSIFNEFIYDVSVQLSFAELLIIKEALRNESVDDINYGFIEHPDEDGNLVEAYPMKIVYNPISLKAMLTTWGKA